MRRLSWNSTRLRFRCWLAVSLLACAAGRGQADVIFWDDQKPAVGAAFDAIVLRYDASGALIVPEGSREEEGTQPRLSGEEDLAVLGDVLGSGQGARLAAVLPALRLTTARYADHSALERVGLTATEWAFLFQALVRVESAFHPEAVSPAGARGLAQLMPDTARALGVAIDEPRENLDGGARYLLAQIATFGSLELALAAYNAGPEAVRNHRGIPPYAETRAYVVRVLAEFNRLVDLSEEGTPS